MDIELSGANPVGNNATDLQKQRNHYGHEGCEARFPKKNYNETQVEYPASNNRPFTIV